MPRPDPDLEKPKEKRTVWVLNLILPGLGNLYAGDVSAFVFIPLTLVVFLSVHSFTAWLILYLLASSRAVAVIGRSNARLKTTSRSERPKWMRGVNVDPGVLETRADSKGQYVTGDMLRKLRQAEEDIKDRSRNDAAEDGDDVQDMDEAQRHRLSPEEWLKRQEVLQQAAHILPPDRPTTASDQPSEAIRQETTIISPGFTDQSMGVSGYQPYLLPELTPLPAQLPEPASAVGIGSAPPAAVSTATATCRRCQAARSYEFSFCLNCGHSYDIY